MYHFKKIGRTNFSEIGRTNAENESENENEIESEIDIENDTESEVVYRKKNTVIRYYFQEILVKCFLEKYISILPKIEKCNLPP